MPPQMASPPAFPEPLEFTATPSILFDVEEFLHFLDGEDWSDEQKRAYAQAMAAVVVALLDWNFRFHPVQEAIDAARHLERSTPSC